MVPHGIEPQWQMTHNLQTLQYTHMGKPQQVQDHGWTKQHDHQDMARIESKQWIKPHQNKQQHPQMELTEIARDRWIK
jgi:uncharacterized membrane protein